MSKLQLARIKDYGHKIMGEVDLNPTRYSDCNTQDIINAKRAIRESERDKDRRRITERKFFEKGIELSIKNRTIGVEISRNRGPKGEDIRSFGEIFGRKHNYGTHFGDIDSITINLTLCTREAQAQITEKIDQYERVASGFRSSRSRREAVDEIVFGAIRKTKTPNLEDHRLMGDILELIGVFYIGREIEELTRNKSPEEIFEELVQRNLRNTALHEIRHREDREARMMAYEKEFFAHITEFAGSDTTLGILQLPVDRNMLRSPNSSHRGAELLLEEISKYFGLYGMRDAQKIKRKVNEIFDFDQIIFRRAAQEILEKHAKAGKYRMSEEEMLRIERMRYLEGRARDYALGI